MLKAGRRLMNVEYDYKFKLFNLNYFNKIELSCFISSESIFKE